MALDEQLRGLADRTLDGTHVTHGGLAFVIDRLPDSHVVSLRADYPADQTHGDGGPYRGGFTREQLSAKRPLFLTLSPESKETRTAKRDGINRELQTGDAAFDDAVYVDSPCDDATLLAILQPRVRSAIAALITAGAAWVKLDDSAGKVAVQFERVRERTEAELREILDAFVALVGAVPPLDKAGVQRAPEGRVIEWLVLVTLLAIIGAGIACFVSIVRGGYAFRGAGLGALCGIPLVFVPRYRGRSNAAEQRSIAGGLLLFLTTSLGAIIGACL